jgi:hypothetical protein
MRSLYLRERDYLELTETVHDMNFPALLPIDADEAVIGRECREDALLRKTFRNPAAIDVHLG